MMNTDVSLSTAAPNSAAPRSDDAVIVIPVNRGPDTDIPLPQGPGDPSLPTQPSVLQAIIVELRQALAECRQRIAELEQGQDALIRRLHRTPRDYWQPDQLALFVEVHPDAVAAAPADSTTAPLVDQALPAAEPAPRPKKKGHGRRSLQELLQTLPRQRCEHPLGAAELSCPCCGRPRRKIGAQTTHQVEFEPARLVCIEHVQFTYSCPHCEEHIVTAPKPPQPIDRGLAGPGLLAFVTASKLDEYLPLYRQELILARAGLFLRRSTLSDWMMALGTLVEPLLEHMRHDLLQSRVVQTDGTSVQALLEDRRTMQTAYFWPHLGDCQHPQVIVEFSLDKTKEHPQRFLADYSGYVQVDAYAGYDNCFTDTTHPKIEVGCWSHVERYFEDAREAAPEQAATALAFIQTLFAIEARAKRERLMETEVLALRQREAVPVLDEFHTWLQQARLQALPKNPLSTGLGYALNQWQALRRYTEAGFLSIDNNATERINKLIARGRINWLFVGSPRAGARLARLLSLVVTCRRLHMDSFAYLHDVFRRLPSLPASRLDELLPNRWLAEHPEARHPPERQGHGHGDQSPRRRRRSGS
jgi:transposase